MAKFEFNPIGQRGTLMQWHEFQSKQVVRTAEEMEELLNSGRYYTETETVILRVVARHFGERGVCTGYYPNNHDGKVLFRVKFDNGDWIIATSNDVWFD